jgi:general secretion pathway protein G
MTHGARGVAKGFTLIELLVVITIIGILSSITIASLNVSRAKGRDAARISDIKQLQLTLELYYNSGNNKYPAALSTLSPTYISTIPKDPKTDANYYYAQTGSGTGYHLGALLEVYNDGALQNDVDATTTNFGGATSDCVNAGITVATNERCYDVVSQ